MSSVRRRGSRKVWRSSLMMISRIRSHISGQLCREFSCCRSKYNTGIDHQQQGRQPKNLKPDPLQENALEGGDEIAGREDIRDYLNHRRHTFDRVDEAGQQERRKEGGKNPDLISKQL